MNASTYHMKSRLIGMSFLQFGVWGAYLISMGTYLFSAGMGKCLVLFCWVFLMGKYLFILGFHKLSIFNS